MPARSNEERLDRLEMVVNVLADDVVELKETVSDLATVVRQGFDQVAQLMAEGERRAQERDRLAHERDRLADERERRAQERERLAQERDRNTNERIDKLVSAIGEFIRQNPSA